MTYKHTYAANGDYTITLTGKKAGYTDATDTGVASLPAPPVSIPAVWGAGGDALGAPITAGQRVALTITNNGFFIFNQAGQTASSADGHNWTRQTDIAGAAGNNPRVAASLITDTIIALDRVGVLARSTDGGATWVETSPTPNQFNWIVCNPVSGVFMASSNISSTTYYSPDDGLTWLSGFGNTGTDGLTTGIDEFICAGYATNRVRVYDTSGGQGVMPVSVGTGIFPGTGVEASSGFAYFKGRIYCGTYQQTNGQSVSLGGSDYRNEAYGSPWSLTGFNATTLHMRVGLGVLVVTLQQGRAVYTEDGSTWHQLTPKGLNSGNSFVNFSVHSTSAYSVALDKWLLGCLGTDSAVSPPNP